MAFSDKERGVAYKKKWAEDNRWRNKGYYLNRKEKQREYQRKNKDKISQVSKARRELLKETDPEGYKRKEKENYRKRRERAPEKLYENNRRSVLKRYNMTLEEYNLILKDQGEKCAICGINEIENKRKLVIDHNHKTGKTRGLLCSKCNTALGLFYENIENIKKSIKYLQKHNNQNDIIKNLTIK